MIYRLVKMGVSLKEAKEMRYPEAVKLMAEAGYESYLERKSMDDMKAKRRG